MNVGSNTGYYSTGLAMRLPGATVHAFEMDDALRAETAAAAARNGVGGRVVAHGVASAESLAALQLSAALVVTDCEGAERELMDPVRVPWLARAGVTPSDAVVLAEGRRPVRGAHVDGRWMLLTPRAR